VTYSPVTRKSLTRHEKIGRVGRVMRMLRAYEYVAAEVTDLSRVGRVHADVTRMLRYEEEDTRKLLPWNVCYKKTTNAAVVTLPQDFLNSPNG